MRGRVRLNKMPSTPETIVKIFVIFENIIALFIKLLMAMFIIIISIR